MAPLNKRDIWVVGDDPAASVRLAEFLGARGFEVVCCHSPEEVIRRLSSAGVHDPALMILDFQMSCAAELDLLRHLERVGRRVPALVLSGVDRVSTAVQAMSLGASDYLVKPFEERELATAIERVIAENSPSRKTSAALDAGAPTSAPARANKRMLQIWAICDHVARTDVPVLILGESGVGKEVLARYIHAQSGRDPFLKVNCAALPTDLLESELFGHERGAFTGAQREKPGKFELAGKGSIMLDEVAEMSSLLQAKLLHVLQGGEYTRLGATRALTCEARIIAATNKRLHTLVGPGGFREDLYFRLNVITIEVPPLRERPEEIRPLCAYFVRQYRSKYNSPVDALPEALLEAFSRYHWPGNIRQLENAVRRFLILPDVEQTLATLRHAAGTAGPDEPVVPAPAARSSFQALSASAAEKAEKEMILRTLAEVNWNRKQAARKLNICYKSLLIKLRRWQLGRQTEPKTADLENGWESGRKPAVRSASRKPKAAAAGSAEHGQVATSRP